MIRVFNDFERGSLFTCLNYNDIYYFGNNRGKIQSIDFETKKISKIVVNTGLAFITQMRVFKYSTVKGKGYLAVMGVWKEDTKDKKHLYVLN